MAVAAGKAGPCTLTLSTQVQVCVRVCVQECDLHFAFVPSCTAQLYVAQHLPSGRQPPNSRHSRTWHATED